MSDDGFAVADDSDESPFITGEFGAQGEASLAGIVGRKSEIKKGKRAGTTIGWVSFDVAVETKDQGVVHVYSQMFGPKYQEGNTEAAPHCQTGSKTGSAVNPWAKALGLFPLQFSQTPNEDGDYPLQGVDPTGMKVLVKVVAVRQQDGSERMGISDLKARP